MRPRLSRFVPPPKLKRFLAYRKLPVAILDVGCGNHSPTMTKHWFPRSTYYGLDVQLYNNSLEDLQAIDQFYEADLREDSLEQIPDGHFDIILMVHVVEHITNGEDVICRLSRKLKPGGRIYVETPSERSATLPSGMDCLNFYDDPTHVRLYTQTELELACTAAGMRVVAAGLRRDMLWMVVGLALLPKQLSSLARHGKLFGPGLWDWLGFAQFVEALKPTEHA
jgi:2-polyprenyl-3-methyl-5-hydroxy-6-metoxy-1,4-benzoquinol methylase